VKVWHDRNERERVRKTLATEGEGVCAASVQLCLHDGFAAGGLRTDDPENNVEQRFEGRSDA
jgi:hypothetical protein